MSSSRRTIEILVYRQEKIEPTNFMLVTAVVDPTVIHTELELINDLKSGVTAWAKSSPEGRQLYDYAGSDMNIGDIASHGVASILPFCSGIHALEVRSLKSATFCHYDTSLCEELPEEDTLSIQYQCPKCEHVWQEEWTCACDSECPQCGTKNITPVSWEPLQSKLDYKDK